MGHIKAIYFDLKFTSQCGHFLDSGYMFYSSFVIVCFAQLCALVFLPLQYTMYIVYVCACSSVWLCSRAQESICRREEGMDGVSVEACGRQAQGT